MKYFIQILFVLIDTGEPRNGRILEYFRVRREEAPLVRMVNLTDNLQYQLPSDQLDLQTIIDFCQSYLQGKIKVRTHTSLKHSALVYIQLHCSIQMSVCSKCLNVCVLQPKLQSEPIPDGWDKQPVKELVGINFERVAFNEKKNVLVLFCRCHYTVQYHLSILESYRNSIRYIESENFQAKKKFSLYVQTLHGVLKAERCFLYLKILQNTITTLRMWQLPEQT